MSINIDIRPVDNEHEAETLMMHHLHLAAAYFEATPTLLNAVPDDVFSKPAIQAWLSAMEALYPETD